MNLLPSVQNEWETMVVEKTWGLSTGTFGCDPDDLPVDASNSKCQNMEYI